ncbi:MAG: metallophosphoesterase [Pirellulales bacterium]|nr:metallophosphoesterase [Pirellulales bacterium]
MKLLIVSDIHGNWPALEAVLGAEPSPDAIAFCGDVVDYGPQPVECLRWLMTSADHIVRGNHDNVPVQDWRTQAKAMTPIVISNAASPNPATKGNTFW